MANSNSDELKFSREQGFFDSSIALRWTIALLLGIGLFAFLHFHETAVDMLEFGVASPRYIVAETDFSYPDEEATTILRQEALIDIGKIYRIDADEIRRRRLELENELIYDQQWRKITEESTFSEMYKAIERLERTLKDIHFSDVRTIEKMKEAHISTNSYIELASFDPTQGMIFPEKIWEYIQHKSFSQRFFHAGTIQFIIGHLKNKIWTLQEDMQEVRKIRKILQGSIQQKYTFVPAGSRIIDLDEVATARHMAMLQAMKKAINEKRSVWHFNSIMGSLMITCVILVLSYLFLSFQYPQVLISNKRLFLLTCIILCAMVLGKCTELIAYKGPYQIVEMVRYPLLAPFTAIMITCLLNPGIAIFSSSIVAVVFDVVQAFDRRGFVLTNLLVALFAVLFTKGLRKRAEIFIICAKLWLIASFLIFTFYLYDRLTIDLAFLTDIASVGLFMLIIAVLISGLIPAFESCFGILTDIALMEYMNPNHELLRRLIIEAPGTYQHSLITGNIAEAAALAIGCNGLFCRVATLYHDIGKMAIAQYFTENQQSGMNIHQLLTPMESAQVIMSHVSEGVALARKVGLPEQFIDIIKEHHGTGLVYYFYHSYLENNGGKNDQESEKQFRYPGPKPRIKETVIVMIADCVEAASRTLEQVNEETVGALIEQIIKEKIDDNQFSESFITFEELGRIKKAMVKSVLATSHYRVKYPARSKKLQLEVSHAPA